jgi:ribosomal protein S18 acetylase RimI-like enzyme
VASAETVERLAPGSLAEVRGLLLDLMEEEQTGYDHPRATRAELDRELLGELRPEFRGENQVLVVRDEAGEVAALCWCVVFDPGTGLEGEVAEVYVRPDRRGRGLARRLLREAVELFRRRRVTFAAVWTNPGNEAAIRLYRSAGFAPTEQLVMTWLPLDADDRQAPEGAAR